MVYTRIVQPGQRKYAYQPGNTLLWRISGTVIPRVWKMALVTPVVTWLACLAYDPLRSRHKAQELGPWEKLFYHIFVDMEMVQKLLTGFITFILGFFNSIVFHRWWNMREHAGNMVECSQNAAMHVAVFYVHEKPNAEALQAARQDLIRLLGLAQALSLQACHRVRDHDWLIQRRLLERDGDEHQVLQRLTGPGYKEVYGWYVAKAFEYMDQGMVAPQHFSTVLYSQRWACCQATNNAEDLMMLLNQMIPLAYCHLLEVMVTLYVIISPIALVHSLLWMAIPVAPVVTLFFYGFYVLGTSMLMDPFQSEDGFDTYSILTSNLLSMQEIEQNVPLNRANFGETINHPWIMEGEEGLGQHNPRNVMGKDKSA